MPSKKDKKSRLRGAAAGELNRPGIMKDFIENVKQDKGANSEGAEKEPKGKPIKTMKPEQKKAKELPPAKGPHSTTSKEWWISFSSFILIISLIFGVYFFAGKPTNQPFVYLANDPIDKRPGIAHANPPRLDRGMPVYFTYTSDKAVGSDTIGIQVYQYGPAGEKNLLTVSRVNVKPHWRIIESFFQREYFEYPGKYEIIFETATRVELARQVFHIR